MTPDLYQTPKPTCFFFTDNRFICHFSEVFYTLGYHHMKIKATRELSILPSKIFRNELLRWSKKKFEMHRVYMHSGNSLAFVDFDYEGTKKILHWLTQYEVNLKDLHY